MLRRSRVVAEDVRRALPLPIGVGIRRAADAGLPALFALEERCLGPRAAERRRLVFALGRAAARDALGQLGMAPVAIGCGRGGEPLWPAEVVGAISHSGDLALAIVGWRSDYAGLGVDLEQLVPGLSARAARLVCTPAEMAWTDAGERGGSEGGISSGHGRGAGPGLGGESQGGPGGGTGRGLHGGPEARARGVGREGTYARLGPGVDVGGGRGTSGGPYGAAAHGGAPGGLDAGWPTGSDGMRGGSSAPLRRGADGDVDVSDGLDAGWTTRGEGGRGGGEAGPGGGGDDGGVLGGSDVGWLDDGLGGLSGTRRTMLFSAKEAVFKAMYPIEQVWLGFGDAELAWQPQLCAFEARLLKRASRAHPVGSLLQVQCMLTDAEVLSTTYALAQCERSHASPADASAAG